MVETPIGPLRIVACREGIIAVEFTGVRNRVADGGARTRAGAGASRAGRGAGQDQVDPEESAHVSRAASGAREAARTASVHVQEAAKQLRQYFAGERSRFDLTLVTSGTEFEERVWRELLRIPAGSTRTYTQIAKAAGRPGAARAAGGAVGKNPLAIVIPCHRVIGSDGSLTGFGGGIDRKRWLIDHESGQRRLSDSS